MAEPGIPVAPAQPGGVADAAAQNAEALLAELAPLHPPAVSPWPAWGWWVLVIALLAAVLMLYRAARRRTQRLAWRAEARRELADIRQRLDERPVGESLAALSVLCRRVTLVALPRQSIAGVHGDAWLDALDTLTESTCFSSTPARLLATHPYQRSPELARAELDTVTECVERLIQAVASSSPGQRDA